MVMIKPFLAPLSVSISDLKKNPSVVMANAGDLTVAVLNRNTPVAYLLSAKAWASILDQLADAGGDLASFQRAAARRALGQAEW